MMDDRGASTVFAHALIISIALVLLIVAFTAATTYLDNESDRVVRSQLEVVSEQTVGCLQSAQRTVDSADVDTYEKTCELPRRVAGTTYTIEINDSSTEVTIRSERIAWSQTIELADTVSLEDSYSLNGGPIAVSDGDGDGDLEVTNG